ncbi:MAG: nucleotide exchange factor GrpE [Paludibacter sp.]|jgi:molecular chaperone GrpE|nr:nucleotide exchange factor GrpE [Paludibacter sp.]
MKKQKVEETPEQNEKQVESQVTEEKEMTVDETADQISADIENLNQEVSELKDKNLRLMAEFDNFRKRSIKERADLIKFAGEDVLKKILPLIDDFERGLQAMDSAEDVKAVKEGVDLIYAKFISFLTENGVSVIPTQNEVFNTDLHEAVTTFPAPSEEMKGKIIDCVSKGYTLNEKVIRFAKVVVGE